MVLSHVHAPPMLRGQGGHTPGCSVQQSLLILHLDPWSVRPPTPGVIERVVGGVCLAADAPLSNDLSPHDLLLFIFIVQQFMIAQHIVIIILY